MLESLAPGESELIQRPVYGSALSNGRQREPAHSAEKTLTLSLAGAERATAIIAFMKTVYGDHPCSSSIRFDTLHDLEQLMAKGEFLLAENEQQIVGCAYLEPRIEASRLHLLTVAPSQRRSGVGSQLLEAAERLSSSMQCLFMHLQVMNLHWDTIRFYRHRGYSPFGIGPLKKDQTVSLYCHMVRMCKHLAESRSAL